MSTGKYCHERFPTVYIYKHITDKNCFKNLKCNLDEKNNSVHVTI